MQLVKKVQMKNWKFVYVNYLEKCQCLINVGYYFNIVIDNVNCIRGEMGLMQILKIDYFFKMFLMKGR